MLNMLSTAPADDFRLFLSHCLPSRPSKPETNGDGTLPFTLPRNLPPRPPRSAGSPPPPRDFRRGYALAIELLAYLERTPLASHVCSFEPGVEADDGSGFQTYRKKPQRNVVLEYVDRCADDRATLEGLCAVLTDFVASCKRGVIPDASVYADLIKRCQHTDLPPSDRE